MAYSTPSDLLFGSVPPPPQPEKWIERADEEIDSYVGRLYVTPIAFPATTEARPGMLLIKRISTQLATGRAIMALDAGSQEDRLHQYAAYLIKDSCSVLKAIAEGEITLDGIQMTSPDDTTSAPQVYNVDESSAVEDFFGNFQAPSLADGDRPYWLYPYGGG